MNEGGEAEKPEEKEKEPRQKLMFEEDEEESDRSDIYYTEISSYNSRDGDDGFEDNPNAYLLHQNNLIDSDVASIDLSKEIRELRIRKMKKKNQEEFEEEEKEEVQEPEEEEEFEDYNEFQDRMKNDEANENEIRLDQDVEAQLVEPIIGNHIGYANDLLSILYQPFFTAFLWMFYDETLVANLYGIKIQDFIYYVLYNIVNIPF